MLRFHLSVSEMGRAPRKIINDFSVYAITNIMYNVDTRAYGKKTFNHSIEHGCRYTGGFYPDPTFEEKTG